MLLLWLRLWVNWLFWISKTCYGIKSRLWLRRNKGVRLGRRAIRLFWSNLRKGILVEHVGRLAWPTKKWTGLYWVLHDIGVWLLPANLTEELGTRIELVYERSLRIILLMYINVIASLKPWLLIESLLHLLSRIRLVDAKVRQNYLWWSSTGQLSLLLRNILCWSEPLRTTINDLWPTSVIYNSIE